METTYNSTSAPQVGAGTQQRNPGRNISRNPRAVYGVPSMPTPVAQDGTVRTAPPFDASFNIDQRFSNDRNKRSENLKAIEITDVRRYTLARDNSPRVAFNRGQLHISLAQLQSAGVYFPEVLVGKTIMVDYFVPGDILLNGSPVATDGIIINQFTVETDMEVARTIQIEDAREAHHSWAAKVSANRRGASNRPQGLGLSPNTANGVTGAENIPQMQPQGAANQPAQEQLNTDQGTGAGNASNDQQAGG